MAMSNPPAKSLPRVVRLLGRLLAFEIQLGPYAVAQLRMLAEAVALTGPPRKTALRMFAHPHIGQSR